MEYSPSQRFATRAAHAGEGAPRPDFTPVVGPIHPSIGYTYDSADDLDAVLGAERPGYVYMRYGNPTVAAFEAAVASLEEGEAAYATASGMAAIHLALLSAGAKAGETVVAALDLYGATTTLVRGLLHSLRVEVRRVDASDLPAVEAALEKPGPSGARPVALLVETISNPLLKVADLPALAGLAHAAGAQLLVDNTFASPYLCNPLVLGADFAVHSATKYLSGHGDVMAGVVVCSVENRRKIYELNKLVGSVLGPFEAWLALRGLKTLPLRVRQQCSNALEVARWLEGRPEVARVHYAGLPGHPQHSLAERQFAGSGFGGVLSFELKGAGREEAFRFLEALRLCQPATTLGDLYTLVLHPATASHRSLTAEERQQAGIAEGLLRLSAGIEDAADIIADLEAALAQVPTSHQGGSDLALPPA